MIPAERNVEGSPPLRVVFHPHRRNVKGPPPSRCVFLHTDTTSKSSPSFVLSILPTWTGFPPFFSFSLQYKIWRSLLCPTRSEQIWSEIARSEQIWSEYFTSIYKLLPAKLLRSFLIRSDQICRLQVQANSAQICSDLSDSDQILSRSLSSLFVFIMSIL